MVNYINVLASIISIKTFVVLIMIYLLVVLLTNVGLRFSKERKIYNWFIVLRCFAVTFLLFIGLYMALLIIAGKFPELIHEIGRNSSAIIVFACYYTIEKILPTEKD